MLETTTPWGTFRQLYHTPEAAVNLLTVAPHKRLSLQSHKERAEQWIILDEGARVQINDYTTFAPAGTEVWISVGDKHRLENISDKPMRVLEMVHGHWKREDIIRYADDFGRLDNYVNPQNS